MQLLIIGGTDFTNYINDSSYKMASQSVFDEWKDADYKIHRNESRKRITGSFDMIFTTSSEYDAFISKIESSNLKQMTVYVGGSTNEMVQRNFYYTIKDVSHREISSSHIFHKITVEIEEQ